jgi:hypothetical protein
MSSLNSLSLDMMGMKAEQQFKMRHRLIDGPTLKLEHLCIRADETIWFAALNKCSSTHLKSLDVGRVSFEQWLACQHVEFQRVESLRLFMDDTDSTRERPSLSMNFRTVFVARSSFRNLKTLILCEGPSKLARKIDTLQQRRRFVCLPLDILWRNELTDFLPNSMKT